MATGEIMRLGGRKDEVKSLWSLGRHAMSSSGSLLRPRGLAAARGDGDSGRRMGRVQSHVCPCALSLDFPRSLSNLVDRGLSFQVFLSGGALQNGKGSKARNTVSGLKSECQNFPLL